MWRMHATAQGPGPTVVEVVSDGWMWPGDPSPGIPAGFWAFFVLTALIAIGTTVWKVTVAHDMARDAGMDPGRAVGATLLSERGFETTYLASSLRPAASTRDDTPSTAERLRVLDELRQQGLIDHDEYTERRTAILDSL